MVKEQYPNILKRNSLISYSKEEVNYHKTLLKGGIHTFMNLKSQLRSLPPDMNKLTPCLVKKKIQTLLFP
jgi:hypothetical protein